MKPSEVVLAATHTFSLPESCLKLRQILDNPRSGLDEFAHVVSTDPILSAKLLQLANSALFRFTQQIHSVQKAVTLLGGEATYNLAMANAAGCAKQCFESSLLNIDNYWFGCLFRGVIAKEIARVKKIRGSERFFVIGVLSYVSEMVIASHFPKHYEAYLDALDTMLPWHAQKKQLGFTFLDASRAICEEWGLPQSIHHPIGSAFAANEATSEMDSTVLEISIQLAHHAQQDNAVQYEVLLSENSKMLIGDDFSVIDMLEYCTKEAQRLQTFF